MPNPGLSEAEIAQTIGAVVRALREGYPLPSQARHCGIAFKRYLLSWE